MNYELAKKLKDAGFPLRCTSYTTDDFVFGYVTNGDDKILYPLLSELIEACGDKFLCLTLGKDGTWSAQSRANDKDIVFTVAYLNSPEEAVAKLWLALNKKETVL